MIVLLDTSHDLDTCAAELGTGVGQLISPLTGYTNRSPKCWGGDCGGFKKFELARYEAIVKREKPNRDGCLFWTMPDVVCNARRTLELFEHWAPKMDYWPRALVAQNGQEDLPIPWRQIAAVFLGGDDRFKMSNAALDICKTAKAMDKWVHVGRVNGPERFDKLLDWGVIDSIDGTGLSRYTHMRRKLKGNGEKLPFAVGGGA